MPIYEYYCPDNHTVYQFYAKTLAQGKTVPRCPDNPKFRMQKAVSAFAAITGGKKGDAAPLDAAPGGGGDDHDPRVEAALHEMESEMAHLGDNDPRAVGRMMRRVSEISGEKLDGEMEEIMRKLEEGVDPESIDSMLGADEAAPTSPYDDDSPEEGPAVAADHKEPRHRFRARTTAPRRDPKLYDYE